METTAVKTRLGVAALRDLVPSDIDAVLHYWYTSGDDYLDALGIDRSRLGSTDQTRQRFLRAIRSSDPNQQSLAFAITLNREFVGYTLLNRYAPADNYSHWHITNPRLRATGLSTALYPHRIQMYFDSVRMERLTHQTRTTNIGVNRMLDRYVPVAETHYVDDPDGVALPGTFHLRYVYRKDLPRLFDKAATLLVH
jgi:hypothetical protein